MLINIIRKLMYRFNTQAREGYLIVYLLITISGMVFCDFSAFFDSELKTKWFCCYISVSISAFLLLFINPARTLKMNSLGYLLVCFLIYCLIRAAVGHFFISYITFGLLFLLMYYLFAKFSLNSLFVNISVAITIVVFVMALYGIIQYMDIFSSGNQFRVRGNFDHPVGYASMLTFGIPFVLYFIFLDNRVLKFVAWIIYIMAVIAVVLSESRTGVLSILILTMFFVIRKYKGVFEKKVGKLIMIILVIIAIFGLYMINEKSSNGRIYVWKCSLEMIKDMPFFGHGYNSFEAKYMIYQSDYLKRNSETEFLLLSDNIKHPFNEFILLIVEFGLVAFVLFIIFALKLIFLYHKPLSNEIFVQILVLLSIAVYSSFSYPFKYPFTWFVSALSLSSLSVFSIHDNCHNRYSIISKFLIVFSSLFLFIFAIKKIYYENKWYKTLNMIESGTSYDLVLKYRLLYSNFKQNAYFLYNYAAILNRFQEYRESLVVLEQCTRYLNDYDIQMLIADNYLNLKELDKAEFHFYQASYMCPNRFIPLYKLHEIYKITNRIDDATRMAYILIGKEVKITSPTISIIQTNMKKYLELNR